jgi:hypothetical protein
MAYFQTKKSNLGKFWRVLQWKMLVYFMVIWSVYCHLLYIVVIRYILWLFCVFFPFGNLYHEKSSNRESKAIFKRDKKHTFESSKLQEVCTYLFPPDEYLTVLHL